MRTQETRRTMNLIQHPGQKDGDGVGGIKDAEDLIENQTGENGGKV